MRGIVDGTRVPFVSLVIYLSELGEPKAKQGLYPQGWALLHLCSPNWGFVNPVRT